MQKKMSNSGPAKSHGGKRNVAGIIESMDLLSKSLSFFFHDGTVAREFAFHLADIEPELAEMHALLQEIKKSGRATGEQVEKILQAVCIHWKYHGAELQKLADGIRPHDGSAGTP